MSAPSLAQQVSTTALGLIASALPSSLANEVITGQVEQVFVWVVKNVDAAAKIVSILQENGFKNIKVDSKGTTITASGGGGSTLDATAACNGLGGGSCDWL